MTVKQLTAKISALDHQKAIIESELRDLRANMRASVLQSILDLLRKSNWMYEALYEISNSSTDWNGYATKAREVLEKVNQA